MIDKDISRLKVFTNTEPETRYSRKDLEENLTSIGGWEKQSQHYVHHLLWDMYTPPSKEKVAFLSEDADLIAFPNTSLEHFPQQRLTDVMQRFEIKENTRMPASLYLGPVGVLGFIQILSYLKPEEWNGVGGAIVNALTVGAAVALPLFYSAVLPEEREFRRYLSKRQIEVGNEALVYVLNKTDDIEK